IGEKLELTLALEKAPRIINQLEGFRPRENRRPSHDAAGHKVRAFGLEDARSPSPLTQGGEGCFDFSSPLMGEGQGGGDWEITAPVHAPIVPRSGASGSAFPSGAWERGEGIRQKGSRSNWS